MLSTSKPPGPRSRFSIPATFVFLTGRIPRGRGVAPRVAIPEPEVPRERLVSLLDESERALERAEALDPGTWIEHPSSVCSGETARSGS